MNIYFCWPDVFRAALEDCLGLPTLHNRQPGFPLFPNQQSEKLLVSGSLTNADSLRPEASQSVIQPRYSIPFSIRFGPSAICTNLCCNFSFLTVWEIFPR